MQQKFLLTGDNGTKSVTVILWFLGMIKFANHCFTTHRSYYISLTSWICLSIIPQAVSLLVLCLYTEKRDGSWFYTQCGGFNQNGELKLTNHGQSEISEGTVQLKYLQLIQRALKENVADSRSHYQSDWMGAVWSLNILNKLQLCNF